jgi:hypothetical protein
MYVEPNIMKLWGVDKLKGLKSLDEHWVEMMSGFYSLKGC